LYTKVGAATRQCAYCIDAVDGRVLLAAPDQARRLHLLSVGGMYREVGVRCARVLREA
jgi:hypothetical protein